MTIANSKVLLTFPRLFSMLQRPACVYLASIVINIRLKDKLPALMTAVFSALSGIIQPSPSMLFHESSNLSQFYILYMDLDSLDSLCGSHLVNVKSICPKKWLSNCYGSCRTNNIGSENQHDVLQN